MRTDTTIDHFDEMTDFLTREAKAHVLDSLACVFHNEGFHLEGNTEANDVRWLANLISREIENKTLDRCSDDRQKELMKIARVAKECIPALQERMAARYIAVSKAIRTLERIAHSQKYKRSN